ncbi:MAG TPA: YsnF/AvaK domain-containing protein [Streptosporangiaceae bacterium]|jgi:uncharacterized protein (TIGR02271 family)
MTSPNDAQQYIGRTAVDLEGNKVGKIGQVYLDDSSSEPLWVTVSTGLFGNRQSFAPIAGSAFDGEDVRLAVTKDTIKDAPNVDDDEHINGDEQNALYAYYGDTIASRGTGVTETGRSGVNDRQASEYDTTGTVSQGQTGTGTGTGDDAMTRSEERLNVGKETVEAGRARLRKHVVTENVTRTVPVSHEEVRLEREPITEGNRDAAVSGEPISEDVHEVTLRAERPVVEKETVPVERVRLATDTVTEDAQVSDSVRKERIDDVDVDDAGRTR